MEKKLISKALEANLAETRYKDVNIPSDYQAFINLSKKYYGINKRANDCIVEFQHPFSNRKFVIEELRSILLTDFWFYKALIKPENAFSIPLKLMQTLLLEDLNIDQEVLIIKTLLDFSNKLFKEEKDYSETIMFCLHALENGLKIKPYSFIVASKYFERSLKSISQKNNLSDLTKSISKNIYLQNILFWEKESDIEQWLSLNDKLIKTDRTKIINQIGKPWFRAVLLDLNKTDNWNELVNKIPNFDQIATRFSESIKFFDSFVDKFYFIFYLLKLKGMISLHERLIWELNKMLQQTIDELDIKDVKGFTDQIFQFAEGLKKEHGSSVLDIFQTLGKKIIDLEKEQERELTNYFENKLIDFGFETPGVVFVNENWQLSVNENHLKNIRVWLELIEYSESNMEKLLSALIVNLRLGGIFINDTDLFQRDITKILNSNIAPYYKKVKQLTRIFPVYFNEIGAEGEIRKVTTTMDEISHREDKLVHFLRKQVHTESNNTLIGLTLRIFKFWHDGKLEHLKDSLPLNVYNSINKKSGWYAPIHNMVNQLCELNNSSPEELINLEKEEYESLLNQLPNDHPKNKERLRDIRILYDHLKEKYSFETVDIINLLSRYSYFEEKDINRFQNALENNNIEQSLKNIYGFMNSLKNIIFNPKPSKSWENIYHKRHIAIGIPSMYGVYREPKFEALGLTFRLENVATRLMEKFVDQINLNYISAKTLNNIYQILDYFREGLQLDGIINQSFNSNLLMLKYSLRSQSFSFDQYINIFQFIAEDIKRTIERYFLDTYETPLNTIIPQILKSGGPETALPENFVETSNKMSEEFYRNALAEAFLMQPLDNFTAKILVSLRRMADNIKPDMIQKIMSYNSNLIVTQLRKHNPIVDNQVFLGSKAYHLKKLRLAGFPVPPGFVLTTEVFRNYKAISQHSELLTEMDNMIHLNLKKIEFYAKKNFGDPLNPLLLSVRSGTAISMPGAMDTILNVGLNDEVTESLSKIKGFEWAAWDSYRRLIQSWGMAFGMERDTFDRVMEKCKLEFGEIQKSRFTPQEMRTTAFAYKKTLSENNITFEEDVFKQLLKSIHFVIESWSSERAKVYRKNLQISNEWGTAVVIQQMIFGNLKDTSGSGVTFTQNPKMRKQGVELYGDYTLRSQGEDIVAGLVKPMHISNSQISDVESNSNTLENMFPAIYKRLNEISTELTENYGYGPQEVEFTFESEKPEDLHILQIRDLDMHTKNSLKIFNTPFEKLKIVGRGIGIGGSALNGRIAFDMEDISKLRAKYPKENIILVRPDTVPDDIGMIFATDGLLTAKGGATSHAAVTATRLGRTSIVNCTSMLVFENEKRCKFKNTEFAFEDKIAIDGNLGNIFAGNYPIIDEKNYKEFRI
jgi:pyruvate,orthophosphate dikinase